MMREIFVTTESGNDVPPHIVEQYGLYVASMHITMRDTSYADGSIPVQEIFDYYNETKKVPTTSAVNVDAFEKLFAQVKEEHPGCVIFHLAYSAVTTCSYQNAKTAGDEMDDIYYVDGKNVTGGSTAFIVKAMEIINKRRNELDDTPEDYNKLVAELEDLANDVHFSFLPGNLDFLKAGGRVSNAAYLGATLLKIKPLIELKNGELIATKKYRGTMEKLAEKFITDFVTENQITRQAIFMVGTGNLPDEVKNIMIDTAKKLGFERIEFNPCGLVITCHSGPASIGVGGWKASRDVVA